LTEQERQELYAQVGYDAKQVAQSTQMPPHCVKFQINLQLEGGTLGLSNSKSEIIRGQVIIIPIIE
jgi:hypothetical protein